MNRIGTDGGLAETLEVSCAANRRTGGARRGSGSCFTIWWAVWRDGGYLTVPAEELAVRCAGGELRRSIARLQTLEPAGGRAADLSQCLYLQLQRIGNDATQIVLHHLEALAKRTAITRSQTLHISQEEVRRAQQRIRQLDPPAGATVQPAGAGPMVYPDVFVVEQEGGVRLRRPSASGPMLHLNRYYQDLYRQTDDPEVKSIWRRSWCRRRTCCLPCGSGELHAALRPVRDGGAAGIFRDGPVPCGPCT